MCDDGLYSFCQALCVGIGHGYRLDKPFDVLDGQDLRLEVEMRPVKLFFFLGRERADTDPQSVVLFLFGFLHGKSR